MEPLLTVERSNADKRHAVTRLLNDPEWVKWSDREIARACCVNNHLVGQIRSELAPPVDTGSSPSMERTFTHHKTGAPSVMNTARIGSGASEESPENLAQQEDQANGFIWSRVNAIEEELGRLDLSPEEAAERFPVTLSHAFSKEKALYIADWFERFATRVLIAAITTSLEVRDLLGHFIARSNR